MINTKTLFILGAGASKPFKYPTGIELHDLICSYEKVDIIAKALTPVNEDRNEYTRYVNNFITEFSKSSVYSIDSFLEKRTEFMDMGKMAIAAHLIPCEKDEYLRKIQDNWYMYLFDRLKLSFDNFDRNGVAFITFNYDRSLEQFLFEALKCRFGKTDSECCQKLKNIPILHFYGQLDSLPWQGENGFSYSHELLISRIRNARTNLKLINDERQMKDSKEFSEAVEMIKWAEHIYFLGFGFDEINLERLNIQLMNGKSLVGTALGIERTKLAWINRFFRDKAGRDIEFINTDVLTLLKERLPYE